MKPGLCRCYFVWSVLRKPGVSQKQVQMDGFRNQYGFFSAWNQGFVVASNGFQATTTLKNNGIFPGNRARGNPRKNDIRS